MTVDNNILLSRLFNRVDNHDIATNSFTLSANLLSTSMVLHHSSLGHLPCCLPAPPRKQCDDALTSLHPYKHHQVCLDTL